MSPRGMLFLVVGPSGVGKDSLIDAARRRLAGDQRFVFPSRAITRSTDAGGEAHRPIERAMFDAEVAAGEFALTWTAHGHHYGVPASIEGDLRRGRSVVVNVSRGVLDEARRRFGAVRVISIVANPSSVAMRLRERGRESDTDIAARIRRATAYRVSGPDVIEIDNSGDLDKAVGAFVDALLAG